MAADDSLGDKKTLHSNQHNSRAVSCCCWSSGSNGSIASLISIFLYAPGLNLISLFLAESRDSWQPSMPAGCLTKTTESETNNPYLSLFSIIWRFNTVSQPSKPVSFLWEKLLTPSALLLLFFFKLLHHITMSAFDAVNLLSNIRLVWFWYFFHRPSVGFPSNRSVWGLAQRGVCSATKCWLACNYFNGHRPPPTHTPMSSTQTT